MEGYRFLRHASAPVTGAGQRHHPYPQSITLSDSQSYFLPVPCEGEEEHINRGRGMHVRPPSPHIHHYSWYISTKKQCSTPEKKSIMPVTKYIVWSGFIFMPTVCFRMTGSLFMPQYKMLMVEFDAGFFHRSQLDSTTTQTYSN